LGGGLPPVYQGGCMWANLMFSNSFTKLAVCCTNKHHTLCSSKLRPKKARQFCKLSLPGETGPKRSWPSITFFSRPKHAILAPPGVGPLPQPAILAHQFPCVYGQAIMAAANFPLGGDMHSFHLGPDANKCASPTGQAVISACAIIRFRD